MRETRFPIHVPENVPGTQVQEHGWEIACVSMSSASRPCGRHFGARTCPCVRVRVSRTLAVWRSGSRRMAFGFSPYGVSSFVHARLGVRGYQGRMVSNLPSPCPSTCYRCPDGALWWLASARTKRPTMGFSLIGALPGLGQRRQGGRECAVRSSWIRQGRGVTVSDRKRFRYCPPPRLAYMIEDRRRRR